MKTLMKLYPNGDMEIIDVSIITNSNLIESSTLEVGYIQNSNGEVIQGDITNRVTDFMKVTEGESYSVSIKPVSDVSWFWASIAYYDENYNYISEMSFIDQSEAFDFEETWICPLGVAYVRISILTFENFLTSFKSDKQLQLSFSNNSITLPQIVKYPSYTNYFIEKNSVSGYLNGADGEVATANEGDRTSDFVNVEGWGTATIRIRYSNMNGENEGCWVGIYMYDIEKLYHSNPFDAYTGASPYGDYIFEYKLTNIPEGIRFIRVCSNYYDTYGADVKISIERGDTQDSGHALAIEDLHAWVKSTEYPVSIFPEGIVIKGNLINTNT